MTSKPRSLELESQLNNLKCPTGFRKKIALKVQNKTLCIYEIKRFMDYVSWLHRTNKTYKFFSICKFGITYFTEISDADIDYQCNGKQITRKILITTTSAFLNTCTNNKVTTSDNLQFFNS